MKKIKLLVFVMSLIIGITLASIFSAAKVFGLVFSFSFGKVVGSGIVKAEKRDMSDFSNIDISGSLNVEIVAQQDFSVEVEGDDNLLDYIKTEVKGETLKIYSKKRLSPKSIIKLRISMPEITELEVSGASDVKISKVNSKALKIDLSGASKVIISGETQNLNLDTNGASKIDAENLTTENAIINSSGASNIKVFVSNELKVDASGASEITYSGNPQTVVKEKSGATQIKSK